MVWGIMHEHNHQQRGPSDRQDELQIFNPKQSELATVVAEGENEDDIHMYTGIDH